jgi:hypothetical protein
MIGGKKNINWISKALYNPYVIDFPTYTKELEQLQLKRENKDLNQVEKKDVQNQL